MDWLGYAASSAVLATFLMRTMGPLRMVGLLSNILFLSYGYLQHIYPVFFLHLILLPINAWRLFSIRFGQESSQPLQAPRPLRPLYATGRGSRTFAVWFAVGLLAGLIGPLTVFTAVAEPAHVRAFADRLIVDSRSTADALAVRLMGSKHKSPIPGRTTESPYARLMRV